MNLRIDFDEWEWDNNMQREGPGESLLQPQGVARLKLWSAPNLPDLLSASYTDRTLLALRGFDEWHKSAAQGSPPLWSSPASQFMQMGGMGVG